MVCCPAIQFGEPLKISADPIFEQRIDKYLSLKEAKKECEEIYEVIKGEAKAQAAGGELNLLQGKYRLTGKPDAKGAFRLTIDKL